MVQKKRQSATGMARLPHNLYMQIQYMLRDCDRLRKERQTLLSLSAAAPKGTPRAALAVCDPTAAAAVRLARIDAQLEATDAVLDLLKNRYASRVYAAFDPLRAYWSYEYFNSVFLRSGPDDPGPSRRQWNYYKTLLSLEIARRLHMI